MANLYTLVSVRVAPVRHYFKFAKPPMWVEYPTVRVLVAQITNITSIFPVNSFVPFGTSVLSRLGMHMDANSPSVSHFYRRVPFCVSCLPFPRYDVSTHRGLLLSLFPWATSFPSRLQRRHLALNLIGPNHLKKETVTAICPSIYIGIARYIDYTRALFSMWMSW